jgi:hypothetical protein
MRFVNRARTNEPYYGADKTMSPNTTADGTARAPNYTALKTFFESITLRTSDPVHLRLLKAASKENPDTALEKELDRIVQEILDET